MSLEEEISCALRDLRELFLQRLVAAGAGPTEGERLMWNAISELLRTEAPWGDREELRKRFLLVVDKHCRAFAELRGLPYRRIAPVLIRHWGALRTFARWAGVDSEEALHTIRDLVWKRGAKWGAAKHLESEVLADLRYGLQVVGVMRGGFCAASVSGLTRYLEKGVQLRDNETLLP